LDENNIIPYILNNLNNTELALKLASRGGLSGADDLYVARFNQLFSTGSFTEAAKVAANSPRVSVLNKIVYEIVNLIQLYRAFFVQPKPLKSLDKSLLLQVVFHPSCSTLVPFSRKVS
jgi:hypothetical protein